MELGKQSCCGSSTRSLIQQEHRKILTAALKEEQHSTSGGAVPWTGSLGECFLCNLLSWEMWQVPEQPGEIMEQRHPMA